MNQFSEEFYQTCNRGDELLKRYHELNPDERQLFILAKASIMNVNRELMNEDAKYLTDLAIQCGRGEVTKDELFKPIYRDSFFFEDDHEPVHDLYQIPRRKLGIKYNATPLTAYFHHKEHNKISFVNYFHVMVNFNDITLSQKFFGVVLNESLDEFFSLVAFMTTQMDKTEEKALAEYADIVRQCIPFEKLNFPN